MQWKELNVNSQMSNTMGNTTWIARQGFLRGHLEVRDLIYLYKGSRYTCFNKFDFFKEKTNFNELVKKNFIKIYHK